LSEVFLCFFWPAAFCSVSPLPLRFPLPLFLAGWLVVGLVVALAAGGAGTNPPPHSLDEETLSECWDVLWDGVIFYMLLHLSEKFGCQLHRDGYLFGLEFAVAGLDFIGVNRVLRERSKVHEKLMDFGHENHG
jgi:hypothetical protein